ncbi:hypothetical protein BS639_10205 [Rouxiella silvae]|uniref:Uncharacterized protein n=1 Tax=Rouxiella silvae TaxID=1646373 RepID=A0ABX3U2B3_9GAMM|nr:hypothetical protein BS639_10205 [Rouxiella silvae]
MPLPFLSAASPIAKIKPAVFPPFSVFYSLCLTSLADDKFGLCIQLACILLHLVERYLIYKRILARCIVLTHFDE